MGGNDPGALSTNIGFSPATNIASELAIKVYEGTKTSEPLGRSKDINIANSPSVPLETPTAYLAPVYSANSFSNLSNGRTIYETFHPIKDLSNSPL